MKQVLQSLREGTTDVVDVPCPRASRGHVLIRSTRTLVSAGTERMLVEFGKAGWIEKARQQPDKVRQVLDKIRTDGLQPTIEAVLNKLDQPLPLGYCNFGRVLKVGPGVIGISPGDRLVSNGKHAEAVSVPVNLTAAVPPEVTDDQAAFTVLGAIALQGIRLAAPTLGEAFVVTGLGLVGLMAVQLLKVNGCRVLGLDYDKQRLELARSYGAETVNLSTGESPLAAADAFSRGQGVDGVLITAATKSNEPVHQAANMCRKRGRIVLVGVAGLELSRADFYEKELSFQVSCSYGPGRYNPNYEVKGVDYPVGFVRWTEQRNFTAVLDLTASGKLNVDPLITHRFVIDDAEQAYQLVGSSAPSLGILLEYSSPAEKADSVVRKTAVSVARPLRPVAARGLPTIAFIGSGNYATSTLIPAFRKTGARLRSVVSNGGVSGLHAARKFGIESTTTDITAVLADPDVSAVVVTTRHDTHANLVCDALAAGKHVFVQKPLALTTAELEKIQKAYETARQAEISPIVTVGFNRRFSPLVARASALLRNASGPKAFIATVNAGQIPADHWTQDRAVGGGRIIGEACHFIDLLRFLAGVPVDGVTVARMTSQCLDTVSITLAFLDGSTGTIHYFANGSKAFPKERIEVFSQGRILQIDNFRKLRGFGWPGFKNASL